MKTGIVAIDSGAADGGIAAPSGKGLGAGQREERKIGLGSLFTSGGRRFSPADLCLCALFAAIIAVCAWVTVPTPIPFTLQSLGVFAALTVLGGQKGGLAILVYLLSGLVGLPVFAGFKGGPGALFDATGGYLLGFLVLAAVYWLFTRRTHRLRRQVLGLALGQLLCYGIGTAWFMVLYTRTTGPVGIGTALLWCVVPFVIPDGVKLWLAVLLGKRLNRKGRIE